MDWLKTCDGISITIGIIGFIATIISTFVSIHFGIKSKGISYNVDINNTNINMNITDIQR